jgi:GNAT superfamily N-acetyltransferase
MRIRAATADDAEAISNLVSEFHDYLNQLGEPTTFHFTSSTYLRDGFGERPAFVAHVAESDDQVIAYIILESGYDTDRGRRLIYIDDLFVTESWRSQGVGKALLAQAAVTARAQGAEALWWGVHERNDSALRFYEDLGAKYLKGIRFMSIDVEALGRPT